MEQVLDLCPFLCLSVVDLVILLVRIDDVLKKVLIEVLWRHERLRNQVFCGGVPSFNRLWERFTQIGVLQFPWHCACTQSGSVEESVVLLDLHRVVEPSNVFRVALGTLLDFVK